MKYEHKEHIIVAVKSLFHFAKTIEIVFTTNDLIQEFNDDLFLRIFFLNKYMYLHRSFQEFIYFFPTQTSHSARLKFLMNIMFL